VKKAAFIYHSYSIPLKYVSKEKEKDLGLKRKIRRIDSLFCRTYTHKSSTFYVRMHIYVCVCSTGGGCAAAAAAAGGLCWRDVSVCMCVCKLSFLLLYCISIHHLARQTTHPHFTSTPIVSCESLRTFASIPQSSRSLARLLYVCVRVCECVCALLLLQATC
jgi:hypothetical protein